MAAGLPSRSEITCRRTSGGRRSIANTGKVAGEPVRVTSGLDPSLAPSPSRDGKRLAYLGGSRKAPEVRIRDIATGKDVRLAEAKAWSYVVLSQDGSTVAFNSDQRNNSPIYSVPAAGGLPKKICAACGRPVEWSRIGRSCSLTTPVRSAARFIFSMWRPGRASPCCNTRTRPLNMPRLSPDGRCCPSRAASRAGRAASTWRRFTGEPVPEKEWTLLIDGSDFERQPFWAPSGNLIYFLSERDGSGASGRSGWIRLRARPVGAPFAAHHMHQIRYNLNDVADVAAIGLSVAGGQMFYASFELQSNIWLAERRETNRK